MSSTRRGLYTGLGLLGVATLFAAPEARAEIIDVTSTTLLAGHEDPRDGHLYTVVPVYEQLSLLATELRTPITDDLKVIISGWGNVSFGDPRDDEHGTGDLDIANVEGKMLHRRLTFRFGRQFVVGGAARITQFDGGDLEFRIWKGLGISGYGGVPVTPRFGNSRGEAVTGGRIFWRQSVTTEAGVSFNYVLGQGLTAREDLGVDARWAPKDWVALSGYGVYSLRELRLVEADVSTVFYPVRMLQLSAEYRRTSPDLFLPLNSVFTVFSQETRDEGGMNFYVRPHRAIRIYGDYHVVHIEQGWGHNGGAKAEFLLGPNNATTLGAEARVLMLPEKGYTLIRAFGVERLGAGFNATLDFETYLLEHPLNGQDYSFTGIATLGWDFAPGWKTVITAMGDVTPFVEHRFELMAKLVYNHTLRFHEVRK